MFNIRLIYLCVFLIIFYVCIFIHKPHGSSPRAAEAHGSSPCAAEAQVTRRLCCRRAAKTAHAARTRGAPPLSSAGSSHCLSHSGSQEPVYPLTGWKRCRDTYVHCDCVRIVRIGFLPGARQSHTMTPSNMAMTVTSIATIQPSVQANRPISSPLVMVVGQTAIQL